MTRLLLGLPSDAVPAASSELDLRGLAFAFALDDDDDLWDGDEDEAADGDVALEEDGFLCCDRPGDVCVDVEGDESRELFGDFAGGFFASPGRFFESGGCLLLACEEGKPACPSAASFPLARGLIFPWLGHEARSTSTARSWWRAELETKKTRTDARAVCCKTTKPSLASCSSRSKAGKPHRISQPYCKPRGRARGSIGYARIRADL